ncbi:unnamed protein product, partial [Rotaria magnacalcarata]
TLTALNLSVNDIGNLGTQYLAGALQINTSLMALDLTLNKIIDEGFEHFVVVRFISTIVFLSATSDMLKNEKNIVLDLIPVLDYLNI